MRALVWILLFALVVFWPGPDKGTLERALKEMEAQSQGSGTPTGAPYWHRDNTGAQGGRTDADIDLPEARMLARDCFHPVKVAVLDGGFLESRSELRGRWVSGWDLIDSDSDPFIADPGEDLRHGTMVAALAAEAAPRAQIMPIRMIDDDGRAMPLASALRLAVDSGARVINVSAGSPAFRASERALLDLGFALGYATRHGAFVSLAAGNYGYDNSRDGNFAFYPAALAPKLEGVVSVAATDATDSLWSGSNTGAELAAPGAGVYAPGRFDHDVVVNTGTSSAAPLVAGAAALLLSCRPDLTPAQLEEILVASADPLSGPRADQVGGRLNVASALGAAGLDAWQGGPDG